MFCSTSLIFGRNPAGGYGSGQSALSSIEEGDPSTGNWKTVGNLPTRRGDVACATVNNLLYVAGGYFDPTGARADISSYSVVTGILWPRCSSLN